MEARGVSTRSCRVVCNQSTWYDECIRKSGRHSQGRQGHAMHEILSCARSYAKMMCVVAARIGVSLDTWMRGYKSGPCLTPADDNMGGLEQFRHFLSPHREARSTSSDPRRLIQVHLQVCLPTLDPLGGLPRWVHNTPAQAHADYWRCKVPEDTL